MRELLRDRKKVIRVSGQLVRASTELRVCMEFCIDEVLWLVWWEGIRNDYCAICKSIIGSQEAYVRIPEARTRGIST